MLAAIEDERIGFSHVRSLHARQRSNVVIDVEVGGGNGNAGTSGNGQPKRWRYRLELTTDGRGPKIVSERVWQGETQLVDRPDAADAADAELLRQTHLEQVSANGRFRDLAAFFASVAYLHLIPQLLRESKRFEVVGRDPFGSDFLRRVVDTTARTRDARLRKICEALRVAVHSLRELQAFTDKDGTPHLRGQFEHWRPQAGWQTERQFSDGTLRLLALLWILADGQEPLLLEEPELSLHPAVVREIPRMLHKVASRKHRQVLLSTHSTDLLMDRGIGLEEILLVVPGPNGSEVVEASSLPDVRRLLESGLAPGEVVLPYAAPRDSLRGGRPALALADPARSRPRRRMPCRADP